MAERYIGELQVTGRNFPPGVGWIPVVIAVGIATIVSVAAIVPQFETKYVGVVGRPGPDSKLGLNAPQATGVPSLAPGQTQQPGQTNLLRSVGNQNVVAHAATGCDRDHNGGAAAPGVTATEIHVTTTDVTTGIGAGFLGEAADGMRAALDSFNSTHPGGICGRRIVLDDPINDGWDGPTGQKYIESFISEGHEFALVGEPDSEGLRSAIGAQDIDRAGMPVVGTDGMLKDQYHSEWVWPVAASTVTNMHIIAAYAVNQLHYHKFGIIYDTHYNFGSEGAQAFADELKRLGQTDISSGNCSTGYCGIDSAANGGTGGYDSQIQEFNSACNPCQLVVMLLEPKPAGDWMTGESGATGWYTTLMGGEPLFDYKFGSACGEACNNMIVWTGYKPDIAPFDGVKPVYTFAQALHAECSECDSHNEFTEGAYLGTQLFIQACEQVAASGATLTRDALKAALDSMTFESGLSNTPLRYPSLPHLSNVSMAAFAVNAAGSFNGFVYRSDIGFLTDPAPGVDQ